MSIIIERMVVTRDERATPRTLIEAVQGRTITQAAVQENGFGVATQITLWFSEDEMVVIKPEPKVGATLAVFLRLDLTHGDRVPA